MELSLVYLTTASEQGDIEKEIGWDLNGSDRGLC
jgi:hypothetical protein